MSITGAWSGKGLLISLIIGFIAVESIVAAGSTFLAPIQVDVESGENKIAVKFASRKRR